MASAVSSLVMRDTCIAFIYLLVFWHNNVSIQALSLTPYACSLLTINLYGKQSNALGKSVNTALGFYLKQLLHVSTNFNSTS